jgi:hypothetical protein
MPESTSMIFTRTCDGTRFLALVLRSLGFRAIPISGQMTQVNDMLLSLNIARPFLSKFSHFFLNVHSQRDWEL